MIPIYFFRELMGRLSKIVITLSKNYYFALNWFSILKLVIKIICAYFRTFTDKSYLDLFVDIFLLKRDSKLTTLVVMMI